MIEQELSSQNVIGFKCVAQVANSLLLQVHQADESKEMCIFQANFRVTERVGSGLG